MVEGERYKLYQGDCLEVMDKLIEKGVKVDAIITDPPFGTTKNKWDSIIPFDEIWKKLDKLIKPNGAIVLFGIEPFSSNLRMSNIKNYRYDLIWEKEQGTDFGNANRKPLKAHENISVFYKKQPTYNPQFTKGKSYTDKRTKKMGRTTKNDKSEHRNIIFSSESLPIENKGKGKENIIKTKIALDKNVGKTDVLTIEEPENHLSHTRMNQLIKCISEQYAEKQILISTHSSFLNHPC